MAKIKLEIISPNKVVYSADIDMLIVRSIAGDLGIMPKTCSASCRTCSSCNESYD